MSAELRQNILVTRVKTTRKFKAIIQTPHFKDEETEIHVEEIREL